MGVSAFCPREKWGESKNRKEGVREGSTLMVPSFKNTASIFPEISFIQYFTIFSCNQYDVITDLICIIVKPQNL